MSETKFLSTLKNSVLDEPEIGKANFSVHAQEPPEVANDSNIPPFSELSEIAKRFLSTFKNLLIFDGWFLTKKGEKLQLPRFHELQSSYNYTYIASLVII